MENVQTFIDMWLEYNNFDFRQHELSVNIKDVYIDPILLEKHILEIEGVSMKIIMKRNICDLIRPRVFRKRKAIIFLVHAIL